MPESKQPARWFVAALVAGALVRAAALPLPGTHDTVPWKIWSYNAATEGVSRLYGVGGSPPEHRMLSYLGAETTVNYPPVALYELGLAGRVYRRLMHGGFPNTTPLFVAIKAPAAIADAGFAVLLYVLVRRRLGAGAARSATAAYWLNPAVILTGAVLGYLDPQFALPAAASLVAAASGWFAVAGALAVIAILTKPQAMVALPPLALVIWQLEMRQRARAAVALAAAALLAAAVAVGPVLAAGGGANFVQAMKRLAEHDMLSGNACNLWWIVGYLVRVQYTVQDYGLWGAIVRPTTILQISRFTDVGYPNPRPIGAVLAVIAIAWALWTARRRKDVWLIAAIGAFTTHAYAVLSAQVHENHLYAAVPLLAIAAAGRHGYRPVLWVVSAILALNLNLFYGIGEDVGYALPRGVTIIDATVVLAAANCAALAWHALVLRREARTEA